MPTCLPPHCFSWCGWCYTCASTPHTCIVNPTRMKTCIDKRHQEDVWYSVVKHKKTGEEREVGQSWTGGLAQGCAPVFQPFGEPGEMCGRDISIFTCDIIVTFNNSSHPQYSRALCLIDVSLQIFYLQRLHQYLSPPLQVRDPTTSWHTSSNIVFDHRLHCLTLLQIISTPQELDDLHL